MILGADVFLCLFILLALDADNRGKNADTVLTLFHFPLIPTVATRAQRKWKGRSEAEVCTSEARKIGEWLAGARGGAP